MDRDAFRKANRFILSTVSYNAFTKSESMQLRQIFGINEKRIDWKFPLSIAIAFITPHLILISFILLVGRLIIGVNTGIFSVGFLYSSLIEIVCYLILVVSLTFFLYQRKIPVIVSILIAAILSRLTGFIFGNQIEYIFFNIATNFLLIVLFQTFIKRFRNNQTGLIIAFFIAILTNKIFENIFYVIYVYKNFGKEAIINNVENGVAIRKLLIDISSGLILSILFTIGLLISYRLLITKKSNAQ